MQIFCVALLAALLASVSTLPLPADSPATPKSHGDIIRYLNENDGSGNYRFSFETSDGTRRDETGILVNSGKPDAHVVVVGSYTYLRPDGKFETISYEADENGYRASNEPDIRVDTPQVMVEPNPSILATLLG